VSHFIIFVYSKDSIYHNHSCSKFFFINILWGIYSVLLWHHTECALMYGGRSVIPHCFCSAKGTLGRRAWESNLGPTEWQAGVLTIVLRLTWRPTFWLLVCYALHTFLFVQAHFWWLMERRHSRSLCVQFFLSPHDVIILENRLLALTLNSSLHC